MSFFITSQDGAYTLTMAGYVVCAVLMIAVLAGAAIAAKKRKAKKLGTRQMVFCAAAIALGMVASMLKIYSFPFGGSVTLCSMLFICLMGYMYGPAAGMLGGTAYGILQLIVEPQIYYPMQVVVDYLLGFGALGLSGFFYKSRHGLLKGYLLGVMGRYVFTVISGWIFFGEYAWEGWGALTYSLAYNACYIFTEAALTAVLLCVPAVVRAFGQMKELAA